MKIKFLLLSLFFLSSIGLRAQNEYLDTTFNSTNTPRGVKFLTYKGSGITQEPRAIAVDKYGRIIIATSASYSTTIYVSRLKPNGATDSTFGNGGLILYGDTTQAVNAIALQPDGKILLAGSKINKSTGYSDMMVIRLNSDGSTDSTFDSDGIAMIDLSGDEVANDIKIQSNGKIILVGTTKVTYPSGASTNKIALACLNWNGTINTAFNSTGSYISSSTYNTEHGTGLALSSDTIVVGGDYYNTYIHFSIIKLKPDGTLIWRKDLSGGATTDNAPRVVIQPDFKIVVAGVSGKIARLNPDGSSDINFGISGEISYSGSTITGLLLLNNSKFILSGSIYCGGPGSCYSIIGLDNSGIIDSSFAVNGKITINRAVSINSYNSALSHDQNLLLTGLESSKASVLKIQLIPIGKIIGNFNVLPKTIEKYKVDIPTAWKLAGYEYYWSFDGTNSPFITNTSGQFVSLFFTDSATTGNLICRVTTKGGSPPITLIKQQITVNNKSSEAFQLANLKCTPGLTTCNQGYIDDFSLNTIKNIGSGCSESGYSDYTKSTMTDTLSAGTVYSIHIKFENSSTTATYFGVWIDYNNDGDFSQPDEFVAEGNTASTSIDLYNIVLKNKDGYTGPKRLRVRSRPDSVLSKSDFCAVRGDLGETEDYLVSLKLQELPQGTSVMTPNNDGLNDYLVIKGINPLKGNKIVVFDRMGELKYSAQNYQNDFAGIDKDGKLLNQGTYYYIFTNGDNTLKGFFEVLY